MWAKAEQDPNPRARQGQGAQWLMGSESEWFCFHASGEYAGVMERVSLAPHKSHNWGGRCPALIVLPVPGLAKAAIGMGRVL